MKKLFLTPLLAAFILLMSSGSPTQTDRLQLENLHVLEQQPVASVTDLEPLYRNNTSFVSQVFESDPFQLLSLNWQEELPDETDAHLEIRFRDLSGSWSDWQSLNEDHDGHDHPEEELWSYVITENSDAFQYRAFLSTNDASVTPKLANFTFDAVSGGTQAPLTRLGRSLFKISAEDIISRYHWGADESLRLAENFEHLTTDEVDEIPTVVDPKFKYDPDLDIVKTVSKNAAGEHYWWTQSYPKEVKKIIVHHTATTKDLNNPDAAVRAIYQYHTQTRAWGDIGYNFIIAPNGKVYQGRAGGPGVVAAHAGGYNTGSVGIALLGNYQEDEVPDAMLESLQDLIEQQAELHDIDISTKGNYRGLYLDNLLMHKDIGATSCPGENAYDYVEDIRQGKVFTTSNSSRSNSSRNSTATPDATVINQYNDLDFDAGQSKTLWVQVKNQGSTTWSASDLELKVTAGDASISKVNSTLKTIPPGTSPRFFFTLTAPQTKGAEDVELQLYHRGRALLAGGHDMTILVDAELPSVELSQAENPIRIKLTTDLGTGPILTSGNDFSLYNGDEFLKTFAPGRLVKVRNTGSQYLVTSGLNRWTVDGPVRLIPGNGGVILISNMEQRPAWNPSLNDNLFRGLVEVWNEDGTLIAINELPLEDYLKGVAEVSNDTHYEKAKAMSILARTYAEYYMTQDEKFPGKPYHLSDDPDESQKYLGYGFERRSSLIDAAVEDTKDMVVTYNGVLVKTPYFSQSNGVRTKSALEVWGWTNTPYLQSVPDSHCESDTPWGHEVGLSGCGAEALAQDGWSYIDIIKYYFTGVEVSQL